MRLTHVGRPIARRKDKPVGIDEMEVSPADAQAVIARVQVYGHSVPHDSAFIARLRVELMVAHRRRYGRARRQRPTGQSRARAIRILGKHPRLASVGAVVAVSLGGAAYFTSQAATPVSAQTVLRRAVTTAPTATSGDVIHQVTTISTPLLPGLPATSPLNEEARRTIETWTQRDAAGTIIRQAITTTGTTGIALTRTVRHGRAVDTYTFSGHRRTTRTASSRPTRSCAGTTIDAVDARQLLLDTQRDAGRRLHLARETRFGAPMYVVTFNGLLLCGIPVFVHMSSSQHLVTALSIDARTYALREMTVDAVGTRGVATRVLTLRVARYAVLPQSSVPSGTFTLNAPASARTLGHPAPRTSARQ